MRNFLSILSLLFFATLNAQESNLKLESYELENGLKVYLNQDTEASTIYGSVWVNAGGKDDPADATGIAHYLEHMLFKGTQMLGTQDFEAEKPHLDKIRELYDELAEESEENKKTAIQQEINAEERKASEFAIPNEFDRLIKSIGSTAVNATTSNDYTNYYNIFPPNQLAKWLDIYAHRFKKPVFRLFQSELEAVYEEKNRAGDDLQRRIYEKFNSYIYGNHPYNTQTVLGSVEHLKNPSLKKMYAFFQTYYVPNNMALVLSGNFDSNEVKPLIAAAFGQLVRGPEPDFNTRKLNSFKGREVQKVRMTPIKVGFMGYKLVPFGHKDRAALEVVGQMMSNSNETGFLDIWNSENKALYAGGEQEFLEEDGSAFIFFVPKIFGKSLKHYEEEIQASFRSIANGEFEDTYFEAIKNGMYREYSRSLEDLEIRSDYIGLSFIYDMNPDELLSYSKNIKELTKEDIQKAADTYFGEDYFTLQSRTGFPKKTKLKKPAYKPITARTEETSLYAKAFEQLPEQVLSPSFIDVDKDVKVIDEYLYYTKNPQNDIFTFRATIAKGILEDLLYPELALAMNNSGTSTYTANELKNKFARLGANFSFTANYNSFDVNLTGIDKNFKESVLLLEHLLTHFKPDDKTIDYLANQRKTSNKLAKNDPSTAGRMLYVYGLFGENSGYLNRMSAKQLKKLDPERLLSASKNLLKNGFNSIHYVGGQTPKESIGLIASKNMFKKNQTDSYTFQEANRVNETTFYVVHDKKAIQSYVYYVVNGEALNKEHDFKKEAFNAYYTNGLSGLLFQEVREFRSLAYAVGGNYINPLYEPTKKGRLVLFTGSQADKTADAVNVVMDLLNDMPTYEERLPSLKNGLLLEASSNRPNFRQLSTTVENFLNTEYESDPNELNYAKFPDLTFEDIQSFYETNVKGKPAVITIYGDTSEFELEQLRKYGNVIELKITDIWTK
ncbi:M16 family metallopeptidase [Maribacter chungangensis]|uniref:M16 family metallopeptidase n=1 Tax=Maribacter chungangensis TaxID=1069117 RepID=A0ABW3B407_9FLAO